MASINGSEHEYHLDKAQAHIVMDVIRLKEGSKVIVLNGKGLLVETRISKTGKQAVTLEKKQVQYCPSISPNIHISIGALKGDKAAWVVQKLTEVGVAGISWVESEFSVAKNPEKKQSKLARVAQEAIRQSGNLYLPKQGFFKNLDACLDAFKHAAFKICLHEKESKANLKSVFQKPSKDYHVIVGPEGGFSDAEINSALAGGYQVINCAPHVLRSETAAIYISSILKGWTSSMGML